MLPIEYDRGESLLCHRESPLRGPEHRSGTFFVTTLSGIPALAVHIFSSQPTVVR